MIETRRRVFYGWWVVLVSALGLFLGPTPIVVFSFGVLLKPLVQEFQSNRGAISLAFTLSTTVTALGLPFAGRLIDRFGFRRVILPSTLAIGLILVSAYFCSTRLWQLYVVYVALGLTTCGIAPLSYCGIVAQWFDRYRGLALGLTMFGLGAGAIIMPPAAQYLIARFGWRLTFGMVGTANLLVALPALTIFLKEKPELMGLWPDGSPHALDQYSSVDTNPGLSWREAWHTSTFWLLFVVFFLISASVQACFAHISAILNDRGAPARTAALASSAFGAGLLVGRTGSGFLLDRFFAPRVAALIFACTGAGIGVLRVSGSQGLAFVAALLIGLGLGAEVDIMAYLTTRYFGLRSFGAIYGFTLAGFGLAAGLGVYLMGAVFETTGSYAVPLTVFCILTLIGAAIVMRIGPYRYQKPVDHGGPGLPTLQSESQFS